VAQAHGSGKLATTPAPSITIHPESSTPRLCAPPRSRFFFRSKKGPEKKTEKKKLGFLVYKIFGSRGFSCNKIFFAVFPLLQTNVSYRFH